MSRINTNVSSLIAQRVLNKNNDLLNTSLSRLSTGLKINSGKDNPAGLIASENLRAEKVGITTAIDNAERASNILGTAEGGLSEVSSLLTELQGLVGQAANSGGLSKEELDANQLQVDSILSTVNRIAGATAFQGTKLLNGNLDYTTSTVGTSAVEGLRVNSAAIPDGQTVNVLVQTVQSAQTANLGATGGTVSGGSVTLEISGNLGSVQLTFASGTTISSVVTAINAATETTGVSAAVSGTKFNVQSTSYGSSQFVGLKAISGVYAINGNGKDTGRDATVTVNGAAASVDGKTVSYRSGNLDLEFDISDALNVNNKSKSFGITGGGATFSLGSKVSLADRASIGIGSVSTGSLGSSTLGFLSSLGSGGTNAINGANINNAQKVLDKAIKQVSSLRGRLGAFQKFTIGSTVNSLGVAYENASAAESAIRDTDFAEETANLTRAQILSSAAQSVLSQANAAPQAALALLRG
jgi:flagellin